MNTELCNKVCKKTGVKSGVSTETRKVRYLHCRSNGSSNLESTLMMMNVKREISSEWHEMCNRNIFCYIWKALLRHKMRGKKNIW